MMLARCCFSAAWCAEDGAHIQRKAKGGRWWCNVQHVVVVAGAGLSCWAGVLLFAGASLSLRAPDPDLREGGARMGHGNINILNPFALYITLSSGNLKALKEAVKA